MEQPFSRNREKQCQTVNHQLQESSHSIETKDWKNKNIFCRPPHETGLVVRGFFIPRMFFENFISDNLNTLADGALKGKATSEYYLFRIRK